jgi:hypothetical protein
MRHLVVAVLFFLVAGSPSCHKSAGLGPLSGVYLEATPDSGATTLNFVDASTVIVTGSRFFLSSLSGTETLTYFLSSGSGGPTISFVTVDPQEKDTLSCHYALLGSAELDLSFNPCPAGVPCDALGGMEFVFSK